MSSERESRRSLKIGLFGGTFDPIHRGHLAAARAARRRFGLDRIYFIPCGRPPHKDRPGLISYLHRYTMVTLACLEEPGFLPSLLEAGPDLRGRRRYYSYQTAGRMRRRLGGQARLYFLLGVDAFLYLPTWKNFRQLIRLCDFIVVNRPGFDWRRARRRLVAAVGARNARASENTIRLPRSMIYFLRGVRAEVSATAIRRAGRRGRRLTRWVPGPVAAYIEKMALYQSGR